MIEVKYLGQGNIARIDVDGTTIYRLVDDIENIQLNDGEVLLGVTGGAYTFDTEDFNLHLNQYAINGETFCVCHDNDGIPKVEELPISDLPIWQ